MTRVEFDAMPANREEWAGWCRHHGIDPGRVTVPGWIAYDPDTRRLTYQACVHRAGEHAIRCLTSTEYVQLEARPLPFPELISH